MWLKVHAKFLLYFLKFLMISFNENLLNLNEAYGFDYPLKFEVKFSILLCETTQKTHQ